MDMFKIFYMPVLFAMGVWYLCMLTMMPNVLTSNSQKSQMAQWLRLASQGRECTVHDLEIKGLNPSQVELVVYGSSV